MSRMTRRCRCWRTSVSSRHECRARVLPLLFHVLQFWEDGGGFLSTLLRIFMTLYSDGSLLSDCVKVAQ